MNGIPNLVGQWYLRRDLDEIFQVTGYDERWGTIEIQTFDGDLDEIDEENWRGLPLAPVEAPKDWTGPLDGVELEEADPSSENGDDVSTDSETWQELAAEADMDTDVDDWMDQSAALPAHYESPATVQAVILG